MPESQSVSSKKQKLLHFLQCLVLLTVGASIYGFGIAVFLDPNRLAPGGVSGLSIIINSLVDIGTGVWIFLINIPIMIIGLTKP